VDASHPPPDPATLDDQASKDPPPGEPFEITWERWRRRSGDYLGDIGWLGPTHPLGADALHKSREHQVMETLGVAQLGAWLLMDAIRRHGAVELAGDDPDGLEPRSGYYARLHAGSVAGPSAPCVKVAGTKNRYWFLDEVFNSTWDPREEEQCYRCEPRPEAPEPAVKHLASLLLSVRALPGTQQLVKPMNWPSWSDPALVGYLAPWEVRELAAQMPWLRDTSAAKEDELFDLFADRVHRSAAADLALVTFYSGL
jgi:hypothetical protein